MGSRAPAAHHNRATTHGRVSNGPTSAPPAAHGDRMPRRERVDVSLLVGGNAVSALGNAVYLIAVTLLLKELTGSPFILGLFQFLALSPGFVLSPVIGAVIDRASRRLIIIASDLARGVVMIAAGVLLTFPGLRTPFLVLLVALLAGIGHALFVPAVQSLLPSLVHEQRLHRATGLRVAGSQLGNLSGSAAGGALYALVGAPMLFVANGVTFLASAIQEAFISPDRRDAPTGRARESLIASARAGLGELARDLRLGAVVGAQAGLFAVAPVLMIVLPFVVLDELRFGEAALGLYLAVALAGGVLAFLLTGRAGRQRLLELPLVPFAYALLAAAFAALAVTRGPIVLGIAAFVSGVAAGAVYLYAVTWIQVRVKARLHGRLFSLLEAANSFVAPLAYLAAGAAVEFLGRERWWLLFLVGAAILAVGAVVLAALLRGVSDRSSRDTPAATEAPHAPRRSR